MKAYGNDKCEIMKMILSIMIKDYWACITKLEIKGNWWNDLVLAWFRDWLTYDVPLNMYESPLFPYLIMVKNDLEVDNMWHVGQIYMGHLWSPWPLLDQNVHWNWTAYDILEYSYASALISMFSWPALFDWLL